MNQGKRLIVCLLTALLACGLISVASADVASLGIYFCGVRTGEDGSRTTVRLEGQFRVLQNGQEAGVIEAGKTTVTLPETGRVRIVPLPETVSPEWDLSTAYCEVVPEAGGTTTVPVMVYPLTASAAEAEPKAEAPAEETEADLETEDPANTEVSLQLTVPADDGEEEAEEPAAVVAAGPTPTLPPVDPVYLQPTPEPDLSTLHVSGQCWFDETADGLFKDGEPTMPGVKIELDGVKNGLHFETVSGADGKWCIDGLSPAFYDLKVTAPDGMMFARISRKGGRRSILTKDGSGTASRQIDLNDKESRDGLYIGFTWTGEIRGRCFLDANYNGLYDEGEQPMPGVRIMALKSYLDTEAAKAVSGEDGTFVLTGLRANTYKIRVVLPEDGSDFSKTVSDPLGNHFKSRPGRRENFWNDFVLGDAQTREMNVGVIYPASITGTVYYDDDFSADLSGSEKIVSGFLVGLYDESGNVVAMDKTSIKGKFELTKLVPGTYTLHVNAVKGYAFTKLGDGNVIVNRTGGEGFSEPFFLALGENRTGMDVGMIKPGTVEGAVFADRNDNGIRDEGENGLPGAAVALIGEDGEEAFRTDIGEDGKYLFDAVMPGRYHLKYTLPEGAVFARTVSGGNVISGEDGIGLSDEFNFTSGATVQGPECGMLTLGRIEGRAYHDHDGDGLRGEGEEDLSGMTVTLTPSREELDPVSVTTGEDGSFLLADLRPDTYTLSVTCPEDHVLSRTDSVQLPLTAGKASQNVSLNLAMGAKWTGQQLGAVIPAALKGQLWLDENNNGLFDEGESTPAGYEITVTDDLTGRVFDTLRTDEEGWFETSGMIPGNFTVSFPLDSETVAPKAGDSNFTDEGDRLTVGGITLAENETREGLLLGIVKYTSIGGSVWIDRGDAVEPLAGAEIRLLQEDGSALQTQTTGGSGEYLFANLMPGTYYLDAAMPEGCVIIEPGDRRLNENQISVITHSTNRVGTSDAIELLMGEDQRKLNIGCVLPGRLGDFCWLDLDKDGLQGMDEPGIPNVRIELLRDGETIAETVTDQYGFWRFEDLYPAIYTLRVEAPDEVKATQRRTDLRIIASVLEEEGSGTYESVEIPVESDKANYNADIGFVCKQDGVVPTGTGEGKTQIWTGYKEGY